MDNNIHIPGLSKEFDAKSWSREDWRRLERLRASFLTPQTRTAWKDQRDFELYNAVFGRRIAWKFLKIFEILDKSNQNWKPQSRILWDWGCGTGLVSCLLAQIYDFEVIYLHDRHPDVARFARQLHRNHALPALIGSPPEDSSAILLLVSHVLDELDTEGEKALRLAVERSQEVLWLEPGDRSNSKKLTQFRDWMLDCNWVFLAPCPHRQSCPMNQPQRQGDWCHFFAHPPEEAFHSAHWRLVSEKLGIDLRSLSFSFLLAIRNKDAKPLSEAPRWLGRAKVSKHDFEVEFCSLQGWSRQKFRKKDYPSLYRRLQRHPEIFSGESFQPIPDSNEENFSSETVDKPEWNP